MVAVGSKYWEHSHNSHPSLIQDGIRCFSISWKSNLELDICTRKLTHTIWVSASLACLSLFCVYYTHRHKISASLILTVLTAHIIYHYPINKKPTKIIATLFFNLYLIMLLTIFWCAKFQQSYGYWAQPLLKRFRASTSIVSSRKSITFNFRRLLCV